MSLSHVPFHELEERLARNKRLVDRLQEQIDMILEYDQEILEQIKELYTNKEDVQDV